MLAAVNLQDHVTLFEQNLLIPAELIHWDPVDLSRLLGLPAGPLRQLVAMEKTGRIYSSTCGVAPKCVLKQPGDVSQIYLEHIFFKTPIRAENKRTHKIKWYTFFLYQRGLQVNTLVIYAECISVFSTQECYFFGDKTVC